jgi:Acetyltransferase (GNAT) domain/VanZ like family
MEVDSHPKAENGSIGNACPVPSLSCRLLRTPEQLNEIRDFWVKLQNHPEADFEFFLTLLCSGKTADQPLVMVVYAGETCIGLVGGRLQHTWFEVTSGYRLLWRARVRRLALFYGAFMGEKDVKTTEFIVDQLLRVLRAERIDMLVWDGVKCASPLRKLLQAKPAPWCRDLLSRPGIHYMVRLPGSLEELLQTHFNKKRRYWAKRTIRLLQEHFPGRVQYVQISSSEELTALFRDATIIARQTEQWKNGVGYRDWVEQRQRIALFANKGALRAIILYVDNQPASYWICTEYGRGLYLDYTGYAPAFRRYEPGTIALLRVLDCACREGLEFVDMGAGEYEYMRKYSNDQYLECSLMVFAASPRGVLLNGLRFLTLGPIELLRRVAEFCGMEAPLKKIWRRRRDLRAQTESARPAKNANDQPPAIVQAKLSLVRRARTLWRCAFFVVLAAAVYLSWKPSPGIREVIWIPPRLGTWFDENDGWKNVIGFGLVAVFLLAGWGDEPRLRGSTQSRSNQLTLLLSFFCLVVFLELGQVILPMRTCDWKDVLAGWFGGAIAWALVTVCRGSAVLLSKPRVSVRRSPGEGPAVGRHPSTKIP